MTTHLDGSLNGKLYNGRTLVPEIVSLTWLGRTIRIIGDSLSLDYAATQLRVSPRIGKADRFIVLPGGAQVQCPDDALLDVLPQAVRSEGPVAWLEQRLYVALISIVVTLASVGAAYRYGLPALAQAVAERIPITYEAKLGEETLEWFDEREMFEPSGLADSTRAEITEGFHKISQGLPLREHYRLEFRNSEKIGPNAFALPGGTIIITDQMIEASESTEETLAILAHEIGHVERRHALRHVLQDSAIVALVAGVTSDVSSLSVMISGLPALLANAKYSRDFESESDEFAFELLKKHKMSPEHFASLMERLLKVDDAEEDTSLSFLSSHPITSERIARARAAAGVAAPVAAE